MAGGAVIVKCTCVHEFQDATYGNGYRVANLIKPGAVGKFCRCTVCGKEQTVTKDILKKPG